MINSSSKFSTPKDDIPPSPKKSIFNENNILKEPGNNSQLAISINNNIILDQFSSPISEFENSPISASPYHNELSIYDDEFTVKDVGNLKEYIYFVSLLNQNFSFKDFGILKITDDKIELAITPKKDREEYSKYFFDPTLSILDIGDTAIKSIFKRKGSVKNDTNQQNSLVRDESEKSDVKRRDSNDSEKSKTSSAISSAKTNFTTNDSVISKLTSPTVYSMKKETSDTFSISQSDYSSKKSPGNYEFENYSNITDSNGNITTTDSSLSSINSDNGMDQYKWNIEDLGNPSELIILDIEQLFMNTYCAKGSMFKGNSNIFQFNTENKVYVIQAPSKSKKKEICNMIRIIGGMQSLIQTHSVWNPQKEILEAENSNEESKDNIVRYLFKTFDKYENTISELENELHEKTKALKTILENFNNLSKTNTNILISLASAKEKNDILQEKIDSMKEANEVSVNKIRVMHMRLENNKKALKAIQKSVSIFVYLLHIQT